LHGRIRGVWSDISQVAGFGGLGLLMDIWSDDDLDRMESRVDYALASEDDGRVMLIPPQTIKDLITQFRRLRAELTAAPEPGSFP
jgi:hypothetical protein